MAICDIEGENTRHNSGGWFYAGLLRAWPGSRRRQTVAERSSLQRVIDRCSFLERELGVILAIGIASGFTLFTFKTLKHH